MNGSAEGCFEKAELLARAKEVLKSMINEICPDSSLPAPSSSTMPNSSDNSKSQNIPENAQQVPTNSTNQSESPGGNVKSSLTLTSKNHNFDIELVKKIESFKKYHKKLKILQEFLFFPFSLLLSIPDFEETAAQIFTDVKSVHVSLQQSIQQQNTDGTIVRSVGQMYESAKLAAPILGQAVTTILLTSGVSLSSVLVISSASAFGGDIGAEAVQDRISPLSMITPEEDMLLILRRKFTNSSVGPDFSLAHDVVTCSLVLQREADICRFVSALLNTSDPDVDVSIGTNSAKTTQLEVVRIQNRFGVASLNGFCGIVISVRTPISSRASHICTIKVQHVAVYKFQTLHILDKGFVDSFFPDSDCPLTSSSSIEDTRETSKLRDRDNKPNTDVENDLRNAGTSINACTISAVDVDASAVDDELQTTNSANSLSNTDETATKTAVRLLLLDKFPTSGAVPKKDNSISQPYSMNLFRHKLKAVVQEAIRALETAPQQMGKLRMECLEQLRALVFISINLNEFSLAAEAQIIVLIHVQEEFRKLDCDLPLIDNSSDRLIYDRVIYDRAVRKAAVESINEGELTARILEHCKKFTDAQRCHEENLKLSISFFGQGSCYVAKVTLRQAWASVEAAQDNEAVCRKVLPILEESSSTFSKLYSRINSLTPQEASVVRSNVGEASCAFAQTLLKLGRNDEALPQLESCLHMFEMHYGKEARKTCEVRDILAFQLLSSGFYQYNDAVRLAEQNNRYLQQQYKQKISALSASDACMTSLTDMCARALTTLGLAYQHQQKFDNAKKCFQQAQDMRICAYGAAHALTVDSAETLAIYLRDYEETYTSLRYFEDVFKARIKREKGFTNETARVSENMARAYSRLGNVTELRVWGEQSLMINKEIHGEIHRNTALSYMSFADAMLSRGQLNEASSLLLCSLDILEKLSVGVGVIREIISVSFQLGSLQISLGNLTEAEKSLEKSLAASECLYGDMHSIVAYICENIGYVKTMRGQGRVAGVKYLNRAREIRLLSSRM